MWGVGVWGSELQVSAPVGRGSVGGGRGCLRGESSKEQNWEGLRDQTKVSQSGIWKKVGWVCGELHWGVSGKCFRGAAGTASWVM